MGRTRKKSPHGFGRKPFYKEHRLNLVADEGGAPTLDNAAAQILAHKRYGGSWMDKGLSWRDSDLAALKILCQAASPLEQSADALGRPPTTLAHRARDMGLIMPVEWAKLIRPAYTPRVRDPSVVLAFPFIVKARPGHADLMRANALVPKGFSSDVRADICQNVMLALYEGTVTLDDLERNKDKMRYFVAKFYKEQRPYEEVTGIGSEDDERDFTDISYGRWAAGKHEDEIREMRNTMSAYKDHTPAHQEYGIYAQEVSHAAFKANLHLDTAEVETLIESGEWEGEITSYAKMDGNSHAIIRTKERYGLDVTDAHIEALARFCRTNKPLRVHPHSEVHEFSRHGVRICVIYNRKRGRVLTVLPAEELDG